MAKTKPGWFAPKYQTFEDWAAAQKNTNSAYFKRIARAHARYPKATLSELRGHGKPPERKMWMIMPNGVKTAVVPKNQKEASKIGTYWNAVDDAIRADESELNPFKRKYWVDASGKKHPFVTDMNTLESLFNAGELRFGESIYVMEVPA